MGEYVQVADTYDVGPGQRIVAEANGKSIAGC
jgi:hypothetical protein